MSRIMVGCGVGMLAACALFGAETNNNVIGMALAQGGARVDNAKVVGNATLFEGANFQADGYSRIQMKNGTRLDLGTGSRAQVFANHASLENGLSELQSGTGFEVEARTLKIRPAEANSVARIRVDGTQPVLVTALHAPVNVLNSDGLLVARVMPDLPMSFVPQAGSATSFRGEGCIVNKAGVPMLVNDNRQVFQLNNVNATSLRKLVGNKAKATGTIDMSATPVAGATQVIRVATIAQSRKGGCSDLAGAIGATTSAAGLAAGAGAVAGGVAAGAGAAAGAAAGTTAAVVGGVAAAAGAAAAAGVSVSSGNNNSPPF